MNTKRHRLLGWSLGSFTILLCVGVIVAAYRFGWPDTGFQGKTVWDWLQLLIIPLVLTLAAFFFNQANTRTEQKIAEKRYKQDQEIAEKRYEQDQEIAEKRYKQDQEATLDKQREDLLQVYLDRMSELLIEKELQTAEPNAAVRNVMRVRTITLLIQLDVRRVGYVFSFLAEAGLREGSDPLVDLKQANFTKVDWSQANLSGVNLNGVNLSDANLSNADLSRANLSGATLCGANLTQADLRETNLKGAKISELFYETNLSKAFLRLADLSGADLGGADLRGASLSETNLSGADLSWADLRNAEVATKQLDQAKSLEYATMPDGNKHS